MLIIQFINWPAKGNRIISMRPMFSGLD